jgi:hypothetical protein
MTLRARVSCTGRGRMILIEFFDVKIEQAQTQLGTRCVNLPAQALHFSLLAPELLLSFERLDLIAQRAHIKFKTCRHDCSSAQRSDGGPAHAILRCPGQEGQDAPLGPRGTEGRGKAMGRPGALAGGISPNIPTLLFD